MNRFLCNAVCATLIFAGLLPCAGAGYLGADKPDIRLLLPEPPEDNSAITRGEMFEVLRFQKSRTPAQAQQASNQVHLDTEIFAPTIGAHFTRANLPLTFALLDAVRGEFIPIIDNAKNIWKRVRPSLLDKRVQPCVPVPSDASYPSGHAAFGELWSLILANMIPEKAAAIRRAGWQIGQNRVIAGVHYPSDVTAGRKLGAALWERYRKQPAFIQALQKAEAEYHDLVLGSKKVIPKATPDNKQPLPVRKAKPATKY
jgi:acid phosphatase (class A)